MASGFFAIIDDIVALMDDVALTSKIATQKTAGILGDDLAVNAEKATGFLSSRELPVIWKITKGSFLNKIIIIPVVFVLQVFLPKAITIILLLGGFYLAFEGVEKIVEWLFHRSKKGKEVIDENIKNQAEAENAKVKSAIITDFILSLEIVIIALSTVLEQPLVIQITTVVFVSFLATFGVYGIVALLVRMDDLGYQITQKSRVGSFVHSLGNALIKALPIVIKILSVFGTIALLLVAGGIFSHQLHHFIPHSLQQLSSFVVDFVLGLIGGIISVLLYTLVRKMGSVLKKIAFFI